MNIGDKVEASTIVNGEIVGVAVSLWGGTQYLVETDEPFPYIGRPNPRRRIFVHESHLTPLTPK
jgi:hypothetical protein